MEGFRASATSNENKDRIDTETPTSSVASLATDFPLSLGYSPSLTFSAHSRDGSTHGNGTYGSSGRDFVINLVQGFRLSGDFTDNAAGRGAHTSGVTSSDRAALSSTLLSRLVTGALRKLETDLWALHCSSCESKRADFTPASPAASPRACVGGTCDVSNRSPFVIAAKASLEPMIEAGIYALECLPANVRIFYGIDFVDLVAHRYLQYFTSVPPGLPS